MVGRHLKGVGASRGLAIGPAHLLASRVTVAERRILRGDREAELARFAAAVLDADAQLDGLRRYLDGPQGDGEALIEAQRLMLRSPEIEGETRRMIEEEALAAEWALTRALDHIRATFAGLPDPFFRARGADFDAVGERLVRVLLGLPEIRVGEEAGPGSIAVCTELSPLDPFQLARAGVIGIVSEHGGRTSHAAIIARALAMPYVVGPKNLAADIRHHATLIVDGTRGETIVEPDEDTLASFRARLDSDRRRTAQTATLRDLPSVTKDGVRVHLAANVESVAGVEAARAAGAESIGLLRTEFLYLDRTDLPTEEEQYTDAVSALRAAEGLSVTFRTLDLGGDKLPAALKIATGANPALGLRSTRFSLDRPDIFRTQLRALYRASSRGTMRLMLPLVASVTELERVAVICEEVRASLRKSGELSRDAEVPLGVMIETPSAAVTADHLARRCAFLSLGTNDLIQYAFAADRDNEDVAHLYQPMHPAVLRLLKIVVDAASSVGVPLSICGDMAAEPALTWILMGLGLRNLSMHPASIPLVKAVIRASSMADAEQLTHEALALETELDVDRLVRRRMAEKLPPAVAAWVANDGPDGVG